MDCRSASMGFKVPWRVLFRSVLLLVGLYWATLDPIDLYLVASLTHVEAPANLSEKDQDKSDAHHLLSWSHIALSTQSVSRYIPLQLERLDPWTHRDKPISPDTSCLATRSPPAA